METYYSLTISPRYYKFNPRRLLKVQKEEIIRQLNKCSSYYCLYPEFDDVSRLHYHGVIKIKDMVKWHHIKYKVDKVGFAKLKKMKGHKEHLRWLVYSMKNWPVNKKYFKQPIMYIRLRRLHALCKKTQVVKQLTILDYLYKHS